MNNLRVLLIISTLLCLIGCSSSTNSKIKTSENKTREIPTVIESEDEIEDQKSLDKKFIPPNFLVKEFKVTTNGDFLDIKLSYEVSEKLYKFLLDGPKFIFNIEFSEYIIKSTSIKKTENIEGQLDSNGQLNYEVNFSTNLYDELEPSLIKMINDDDMDFRLIIYDEYMVPVHIFENVQWADTFIYGKSDNIHLEGE